MDLLGLRGMMGKELKEFVVESGGFGVFGYWASVVVVLAA